MRSWSESDNYFVSGSLKVYSIVDFSSEQLKLVPEENVIYDGPRCEDFMCFLSDNSFRVNCQGKAIISVKKGKHKHKDDGDNTEAAEEEEEDEEEFNFFLLEKLVPLGPYGFPNVALPTEDVKVNVLERILDETRAELAKKNAMLDELRHQNKIVSMAEITDSMKRESVGFDPNSDLRFLDKLRDLILSKESIGNVCNCKPENVKFASSGSGSGSGSSSSSGSCSGSGSGSNRDLGVGVLGGEWVEFLEFFRRMNKTFVNKGGKYLKFEFSGVKYEGEQLKDYSEKIRYVDSEYVVINPFSRVQYDKNESPQDFIRGGISEIRNLKCTSDDYFNWILRFHLGMDCLFELKQYGFVGKIKEDAGSDFRNNALVTVFFEQTQLGEYCYVDALATTYFVLNPTKLQWFTNSDNVVPKLEPY